MWLPGGEGCRGLGGGDGSMVSHACTEPHRSRLLRARPGSQHSLPCDFTPGIATPKPAAASPGPGPGQTAGVCEACPCWAGGLFRNPLGSALQFLAGTEGQWAAEAGGPCHGLSRYHRLLRGKGGLRGPETRFLLNLPSPSCKVTRRRLLRTRPSAQAPLLEVGPVSLGPPPHFKKVVVQ